MLDVWENTILDVNPGYKYTMDANKIAKGSPTIKQPTLCGLSSRIGLVDNASFGFQFQGILGMPLGILHVLGLWVLKYWAKIRGLSS